MAFSQTSYTGAINTAERNKKAGDLATAQSKLNQIETAEFQIDERQKFEDKVKGASKGGKWGSFIAGGAAGIGVGLLGVAAAPAALIVGGASLVGGMAGAHSGKQKLGKSKWFKSDAKDAKSKINQQIWADSIMAGITAGAGAKSASLKSTEVVGGEVVEEGTKEAIKEGTETAANKAISNEVPGTINWQVGDTRNLAE